MFNGHILLSAETRFTSYFCKPIHQQVRLLQVRLPGGLSIKLRALVREPHPLLDPLVES